MVRTGYTDNQGWSDLQSVVVSENEDGFRAYVEVVDDIAWEDAGWERLRHAALTTDERATVLFIADNAALKPDYPIMVVDLVDLSHEPFRCIASELWAVENNLNIANMNWEEFAEIALIDGVFRGFA